MKPSLFLILLLAIGCDESKVKENQQTKGREIITKPQLNTLLDNNKLAGSILIYDAQKEQYYASNVELVETKHIPASTFKIPNTIIGLETGLLQNEETVFKWDGKERAFPMWEKDLTLKEAFQASCVPCYQELALNIGLDTMQAYLEKIAYPGIDINVGNLNMFWLEGESKISPVEQIDFLSRLYNSELGISSHTTSTVKNIMRMSSDQNYTLSGKTGWGVIGDLDIGWFVGYLEKENEVYFFATKLIPKSDFDMDDFIPIRKQITLDALKSLKIID